MNLTRGEVAILGVLTLMQVATGMFGSFTEFVGSVLAILVVGVLLISAKRTFVKRRQKKGQTS